MTEKPEIWKACGDRNYKITSSGGMVSDFTVDDSGKWIYYSAWNENRGMDIWKISSNGKRNEQIISCANDECRGLSVDSTGKYLAFYKKGIANELIIFSLRENREILNENGLFSRINFSADGRYLRYFALFDYQLHIIDLEKSISHELIECDEDLISSWKGDCNRFVYGKKVYDGGIANFEFYEFDLENKSSLSLFEKIDPRVQISNIFYGDESEYFVLVRPGFKSNSRQIWLINSRGQLVEKVTDDQQYDHSSAYWNSPSQELAYQRYLLTNSDSKPEIWIWEKGEGLNKLVTENAAHAVWLP
ncbi:MAG: hypothetical protein J7L66_00030 [Anaerolineaceae bacterium]|nr:hypothetical protein [Anaerolineaceae bacterium]